VAAYRLAKLLHSDRVPPTVLRTLPFSHFSCGGTPCKDRLPCDGKRLESCRTNGITGSLQLWLTFGGDLFRSTDRRYFDSVLRSLKPGKQVKDPVEAAQISDLVVFDFLLSNPDRFTGGNLLRDPQGRLWFIDNSAAFTGCVQPDRDFERLGRFRKGTLKALMALEESVVSEELHSLVDEKRLNALLGRIRTVRSQAERLLKEHGEAAVLLP